MDIDNFIDEFVRIARRCEKALRRFETDPVSDQVGRLHDAIDSLDESSSNMFHGHHAFVYIQNFEPRGRFDYYSNFEHQGRWAQYAFEDVKDEILRRADLPNPDAITEAAKAASDALSQGKQEVLPVLDALGITHDDAVIRELRKKIDQLHPPSVQSIVLTYFPTEQRITWDDVRSGSDQPCAPPHISFKAHLTSMQATARLAGELAKQVRYIIKYLQTRHHLKGNTVAKTDGKIFIGHGRSKLWADLKDFIQDRLELPWDEFNREPTAGMSTKERLEAMVDAASFAFLVMTGEDEHADGTKHARENVIHEAGLFQGRLGFSRAIILLEEECAEFSNIVGLAQIRFPKGNIKAVSEEIRRVLEREGIIKK